MISIFDSAKWSSSPLGYWTIEYEYRRSGADMQYRFYWKVWLGSASWFYDGLQLQLFVDGVEHDVKVKDYYYNTAHKGWSYSGWTDWYTVSNKTSGTTSFYARLKDTNTGGIKVTSSTFNLAVAPAYATSNQSLASKTETTITMNWSSDNIIDMIAYKLNGGSWVYIDVADGTSGSYTITGLSANTTYSIVTRVRRRDSQLWTDSSALSVATYNYPYVSAVGTSALVIGNSQTLTLYNPLGRSVTVKMYQNSTSGTLLYSGNTSGTSITFTPTASTLYASIPNSQSGNCVYSVIYGSVANTTGSYTYKVKGIEKPSTCTITYKDSNTTVAGITGNNQLILQNKSNLQVTYTEATANNGASISKYTFELNGVTKTSTSKGGTVDFGAVNSSTDLTLKVTITDSRGLTSSMEVTIKMLEYSSPIVRATLERLNNYENESYLTVNATISSVNNGNTMAVKYKYKESGGSYGSEVAITNGVKYTLNCNNEKSFIFSITVTDEFESTTKEFILDKGKFPLYIDTELNAVGINEFPIEGEALRVAGGRTVFTGGVTFGAEATQDGFVCEWLTQFKNTSMFHKGYGGGLDTAAKMTTFAEVGGGRKATQSIAEGTGILKIVLPQDFNRSLIKFDVEILSYNAQAICTYSFGGQIYKNPNTGNYNWSYRSYDVQGSAASYNLANLPIKFGRHNGKAAISIGNATTVFGYSQIVIRNVQIDLYNYATSYWTDGWEIIIDETPLDEIMNSYDNPADRAISSMGIADYIVEQGTSGIWTYRKWNSGIAECWISTATSVIGSTASGALSGGYYAQLNSPPFGYLPIKFVTYPSIVGSARLGSGLGFLSASVNVNASGTTVAFLSCWGNQASTSINEISLELKGRWK